MTPNKTNQTEQKRNQSRENKDSTKQPLNKERITDDWTTNLYDPNQNLNKKFECHRFKPEAMSSLRGKNPRKKTPRTKSQVEIEWPSKPRMQKSEMSSKSRSKPKCPVKEEESMHEFKEYMRGMMTLNGENSRVIRQLVDTVTRQNSQIGHLTAKIHSILSHKSTRKRRSRQSSKKDKIRTERSIPSVSPDWKGVIPNPEANGPAKPASLTRSFKVGVPKPRDQNSLKRERKAESGRSKNDWNMIGRIISFQSSRMEEKSQGRRSKQKLEKKELERLMSQKREKTSRDDKIGQLEDKVRNLEEQLERVMQKARGFAEAHELVRIKYEKVVRENQELRTENKFISQVNQYYKDLLGKKHHDVKFRTFRDKLRSSLSPELFGNGPLQYRAKSPISSSTNKVAKTEDKPRNFTQIRQAGYNLEKDFSKPAKNIYIKSKKRSVKRSPGVGDSQVRRTSKRKGQFDSFVSLFRKKNDSLIKNLSGRPSIKRKSQMHQKLNKKKKTHRKLIPLIKKLPKQKKSERKMHSKQKKKGELKMFNSYVMCVDKGNRNRNKGRTGKTAEKGDKKLHLVNRINFGKEKRPGLKNFSKKMLFKSKIKAKKVTTRANLRKTRKNLRVEEASTKRKKLKSKSAKRVTRRRSTEKPSKAHQR